jgi:hypothetical protein
VVELHRYASTRYVPVLTGTILRAFCWIIRVARPTSVLSPDDSTAAGRRCVRSTGDGLALTFPHWALEGADPDRNPVELEGRGTIVSAGTGRYLADRVRGLDESA